MSERLSDPESAALFRRLFPNGLAGADVLGELAPDGWERSPLRRAFHPTLDQWHAERVAQHRHLQDLIHSFAARDGKPEMDPRAPEPTLEDSRREFTDPPVNASDECTHLVGAVTWEIFSDNHTVVTADARPVDLGSWRGASAFLGEFADSGNLSGEGWDRGECMRFYMGLIGIRERCDYGPVCRLVFRRLQREGLDWRYAFPRIHVIHFDREEADQADPYDYSPSDAFAREQARHVDEAAFARLQSDLEENDRTARERARAAPPSAVVRAYADVFGRWPEGWPPSA